ncbi:MAG: hypothetical protein RL748_4133, partial [Pseudomonadota bacterium]
MQTHTPVQTKPAQNTPVQQTTQTVAGPQGVFEDNRPETTERLQLLQLMDHSRQVAETGALQGMMNNSVQAREGLALQAMMNNSKQADPKLNNTGLPDHLKSGIELLSGMAMDHVKVHYNSSQPAQLNAHAYAQGSDIHLAPGQEQHLPHEAWHVVQQAQGRVRPTMQMKTGVPVNDDQGLEAEADVMGARSNTLGLMAGAHAQLPASTARPSANAHGTVQR